MLWLFVADAEINSASEPAETPVICHVATAVLVEIVPTLTVGVPTVKCPFCESSVAETLDNSSFEGASFTFCMAMLTVRVSPI